MSESTGRRGGPEWFCALLDTAPDVYFRYTLAPQRRFAYVSPAVRALTGHAPEDFHANPALCFTLVQRSDRRVLRQILRARRGLAVTLRMLCGGTALPIEIRTVPVIHGRQVTAIEGVARLAPAAGRQGEAAKASDPTQQRLAALMYEVHDLLHRVLPPCGASSSLPGTAGASRVIRLGALAFDADRLAVSDAGAPVALTSRELLVLRYLLARPGQVVTRQQLLQDVWGYRYTGDDRTVDVHISRLRRKLPSLRDRLVAIKHVGYRLDADAALKIANI